MSQTADIKAMLDWLASCPLATTLNNGDVVFSIEYLGADTGQMQFSLEATPTAMVLEQFFLGSRRAKNYVLASRMVYSPEVVQQAANSRMISRPDVRWRYCVIWSVNTACSRVSRGRN